MNKNEMIKLEIEYQVDSDYDVSRQTIFFSQEELLKNKKIPVRIREAKIEKITLQFVKI